MGSNLFLASRLKIKRANQHIDEFCRVIDAFLKTEFYRLSVEKNTVSGQYVVSLQVITSPSRDTALYIGDAIHNLRAALDYMICELVSLCGGTCTRDVSFPISESRAKLETVIQNGKIKNMGSDVVDLILNIIKPYKGGNDSLYALRELDDFDKHRLLIPVYSVTTLEGITGWAGNLIFENNTAVVEENGVVNILGLGEEPHFKDYGKPRLDVVFAQGQPFEGKAIISTLNDLSSLVAGIIQDVESTYLRRS